MKKQLFNTRYLFLILLIGVSIASCKKDDNPSETIIGTWTSGTPTFTAMVGTKTITQYYVDVVGLTAIQAAQFTTSVNLALQQTFTGTLQLKADNTYTSNIGGVTESGTWSLSADGKKLTVDASSDIPETYDVVELTSGKLRLKLADAISEDLNSDGTPETISIEVELSFTK